MSSPRISLVDVPAPYTRCGGSDQPTPPQQLPQGPRLRAGVCPSCGRLYARNPRTGTIRPHMPPDRQASAQLPPEQSRGADAPVIAPEDPVPVVASEEPADPEEPDEPATVPTGVLSCAECTILIGPGYMETTPFPHPHGPGVVCFRCLKSLERRAARGNTSAPKHVGLSSSSIVKQTLAPGLGKLSSGIRV
jgi:hypothetical protein